MKKVSAWFFVIVLLAFSCLFAVPKGNAVASANSWKRMAEMPTARIAMGVAVVNGKIYAIGGIITSGVTDINEVYDVATNTWATATPKPQAENSFATAVYGNKIYCFGWDTNHVYDTVTDTWETRTPSPTPRGGTTANVVNDKIYVIGGDDSYFYETLPRAHHSDLNEMYDPETDTWTTMAPMPAAIVASCASAVVDDKIYVFGNGVAVPQIYDTQSNTWSYGPATPYHVAYGAVAATTGVYAPKRVYRIGGLSDESTQIFDPQTQTWSTGAGMPTPRRFLSVAVVDDILYAIGGKENRGDGLLTSAANERYAPVGYVAVAPAVQVASPEQNMTYAVGNVSLAFAVDRSAAALNYSLDGAANMTLTGNTTLTDLAIGAHNITIYATYPVDNTGASQTIHFTIAPEQQQDPEPHEPFPAIQVVAVAAAATTITAAACTLLYFKKRKRLRKEPDKNSVG